MTDKTPRERATDMLNALLSWPLRQDRKRYRERILDLLTEALSEKPRLVQKLPDGRTALMSELRPMSEAPRDGTWVIVYSRNGNPHKVRWYAAANGVPGGSWHDGLSALPVAFLLGWHPLPVGLP